MDNNDNSINYSDLKYDGYAIHDLRLYSEAIKYPSAEFNRLYVTKVRLPEGKNNIVYLLTDTFDNSLNIISNKSFIIPPLYRRFYYPSIKYGSFFGKRYKLNLVKLKKERFSLIKDKTKLIPYPTRNIQSGSDNVFFSCADIYNLVVPLISKFPVKRISTNFFKEFNDILKELSPPIDEKISGPNNNNRILFIDADSFAFKSGASLSDNKTNPLFIIYMAFLRNRDLKSLEFDMDILITSKNLFMKFNPSHMTSDMFVKFRSILFKIMKTNLDEYTNKLSKEEIDDLELTSDDYLTKNIVSKTVDAYTKYNSPIVKNAVINGVSDSLVRDASNKKRIITDIMNTRSSINKSLGVDDKYIDKPSSSKNNITTPPSNPRPKITNDYSKQLKLFNSIMGIGYSPLIDYEDDSDIDEYDIEEDDPSQFIQDNEDEITDNTIDIIMNDKTVAEEVLDNIQDNLVPIKNKRTSPVNNKRDEKLREEQKKIIVNNSTIEEILARESSNVPVKTDDKSNALTTINKNMANITFSNFDRTYLEELHTKDILGCFDCLKDKSSPFYITSVDIKDTSDNLNLKETWTVKLVDENKKRHTITVDIPKFHDNRFMFIEGNKKVIQKQNFFNPIVKDSPDQVIITTNYFKVFIKRKETKSFAQIERIISLKNKITKQGNTTTFTSGDTSLSNMNPKYISTLEYDEISKSIFKFTSDKCNIYFSHQYIEDNILDKYRADISDDEFLIGTENNKPILINYKTGMDSNNRTISDIIVENLSEEHSAIFKTIKSGKRPMYAHARMAGKWLPVAVILLIWMGITKLLDEMGITWTFHKDKKQIPSDTSKGYVKFSDGILEYENQLFAQLMMNGLNLNKINTASKTFESFNTEEGYYEYLYSVWGNYTGIAQILNFKEWMMDHITKEVCKDMMLPTEAEGLFIYGVKLLADNTFLNKASDKLYRTRSIEIISAILYSEIAGQYGKYIGSGGKQGMSLDKGVIIKKLMGKDVPTIEDYSTLNPPTELGKLYTISAKGFRGSNSDDSYKEDKRSYDESSIAKLAISTSNDANVGISRQLVLEPDIKNARGYRYNTEEDIDELSDTLKDVNIFSPLELITPGTARYDDPIRTSIACKQTTHNVPVKDASPALISNGFDEAMRFHLSTDFVVNAKDDGEVIEVNEETGFIIVKYKSGENQAICINPEVVKNSGGGFYISNKLTVSEHASVVGKKFKKDDVLAYHDKYFKYSKLNGLRYAIGPLVKVAFMSTYNTYEDAGICTNKLADMLKSSIAFKQDAAFVRTADIINIVNIGDDISIGDALIEYNNTSDDTDITKLLTGLSEETRSAWLEESRSIVKAEHAGKVIDIKIYTLHDPSNLSASLGKIVQKYFDKGLSKKELLSKYDNNDGIIKAGYMLTDSTAPIKSRYNTIKGYKQKDVLIEIFIEHDDVAGVGDKIVLYGPNKQIISEVIPEGYEPYGEFRPDEEISVLTSPGTVARRMVTSVMKVSAGMKIMVELKRKIAEEIKYK